MLKVSILLSVPCSLASVGSLVITSLSAIGYINLLHDIYGTIIIPSAVYEEMTELGYSVPETIEVQILP